MSKKATLNLRVNDDLKARLSECSTLEGNSMNTIVEHALNDYFDKKTAPKEMSFSTPEQLEKIREDFRSRQQGLLHDVIEQFLHNMAIENLSEIKADISFLFEQGSKEDANCILNTAIDQLLSLGYKVEIIEPKHLLLIAKP